MKKQRIIDYSLLLFGELIFASLFTFFVIFFQRTTTFRSVMEGFMITGIVIGLLGWILFLANVGLFEVLDYGVRYIISLIRRDDMDESFFESVVLRERSDAIVHRTMLFVGFIFIIVGSIMYYMYYAHGYR